MGKHNYHPPPLHDLFGTIWDTYITYRMSVGITGHHSDNEKVHSRMSFLCVDRPMFVNATGLMNSLENAVKVLGFDSIDQCTKLVGLGTDGASANIAARGLKGLVEEKLPWIYFMWCLAHRLELAISDALKGTIFDLIDEMLLRLYYIYEKSPKKCRELSDIVSDLQQCIQFDGNGVRPIRSSGSRWVAHKLNAMKRVIAKYGAIEQN